jgi:hypothetical protein
MWIRIGSCTFCYTQPQQITKCLPQLSLPGSVSRHTQSSPLWSWSSFQLPDFSGRFPKSWLHLTSIRFSCISNSPWVGTPELYCTLPELQLDLVVPTERTTKEMHISKCSVCVACAIPWICASTSRLPTKIHICCSRNVTSVSKRVTKHTHIYIYRQREREGERAFNWSSFHII